MANSASGTLGSATSGTEVVCTNATIILDVGSGANTLAVEVHNGTDWIIAESFTEDAVKVLELSEGCGPVRMRVTCSVYDSGTARYTIIGR